VSSVANPGLMVFMGIESPAQQAGEAAAGCGRGDIRK